MKHILSLVFFLLSLNLFAQKEVSHQVYLIGDAGNFDKEPGKILFELKEMQLANPNSTTIYLGDNIYFEGLEPEGHKLREETERKILNQLERLDNYEGQTYFLPGNHDWRAGKFKGYDYIIRQAEYVNAYVKKNTSVKNRNDIVFVPEGGYPGPYTTKISEGIRLIAFDTNWWLHAQLFHYFPKHGSRKNTIDIFLNDLDSLLNVAKINNEKVIMAGHHPFYTYGSHGQKRQPWRFFNNYSPFQLLGLFGANRFFLQDIHQPKYKKMIKQITGVMSNYEELIYTCGHDHNLQYFKKGSHRHILSGAGSKRSSLKKDPIDTHYAKDGKLGYFILTFYEDNSLDIEVKLEGEAPEKIETYLYK